MDHIRSQRQTIIVSRIRYRKVRGLGPVISSILVSRGEPQPVKNILYTIEITRFSFLGSSAPRRGLGYQNEVKKEVFLKLISIPKRGQDRGPKSAPNE